MKQFFKMFFASLLAMIFTGAIIIGLIISFIVSLTKEVTDRTSAKTTSGNVLMLDVASQIHEISENNSLAVISKGDGFQAGLLDIDKALERAKNDAGIKGLYIRLSGTPNHWATLEQLRASILNFKKSGKFVVAYGENITQGAYYLATAADNIYLNPVGAMELKGLSTTLMFFKGTLDKLDIQPEIYYAGKFKSATEPFRTDKMSEPNRLQVGVMQNSIWDNFLVAVTEYTHKSKEEINKLTTDGAIQFPSDAVKAGLISGLAYWDQVETTIKSKAGIAAKNNLSMQDINDYAMLNKVTDLTNNGSKVAVLVAEGEIKDGEQNNEFEIASKTFCEAVRKVANDDNIKAVVLRVNSPGGSALASEIILRELKLLKDKKKHIVVSMGDYAASGGYYISTIGDSIFAEPNTITGSIGVFGMMFSFEKLAKNKLGITFDGVKNAPYADFPTATRAMTPEEGRRIQASIDTVYETFKNHVVEGRKLTKDLVDTIAQGRVWTGTDAIKIKLVDRLGGLNEAIQCAVSMSGVGKTYKVVTYPESSDKLDMLLKKFKGGNSASAAAIKEAIKSETTPEIYDWYRQFRTLASINGKTQMLMPFIPVIQ